jgi:dihydroxyacetone kinase-like protein
MNDVLHLLADEGVEVTFTKVGDYMTSLDMAGISLTLIDLGDENLVAALQSEVSTIAW